jgi:zinc transport system ATP-binding protein
VSILDRVTATVPKGSCTAIIGPNGAGKTTLLLALLGEISYQGRIRIAHNGHAPRIGYVPQRLSFDRGMPLTVDEFLAMGFQKKPLWFGIHRDLHQQSLHFLALVKAEHLAGRRIGALSGGEMQRVLLALALLQEPELLVLDEPSAGVDFQGEHLFCELLDELRHHKGFTQLMVSHDMATVTHHATHVICLNRKVAAEGPPRQALTHGNLTAIFGVHMGLVNSRSMPDDKTACSASCCQEPPDA